MRILLLGAAGTFGRTFRRIAVERGHTVIPLSRRELDLERLRDIFPTILRFEPAAVVHAAALTDVDRCEREPQKAMLINWIAVREVVRAARTLGVPLVYLSTDYVFDGEKGEYFEWDPPHPLSVYGLSKWYGEREVQLYERHFVVRTSWVFGVGGRTFFSRIFEILRGGSPVYADNEQVTKPTYVGDLAEVVVDLVETAPYGLYHAVGAEPATAYAFARAAAEVAGWTVEIKPVPSGHFSRPAPRPRRSVLASFLLERVVGRVPRPYREVLPEFFQEWKERSSA